MAGFVPRYDDSYPQYDPAFDGFAQRFCETGATDAEIAAFFEIPVGLLYQWRRDHPSFAASIKVGKEIADLRVERALYEMAVGTVVDDVKVLGDGGIVPYQRRIDPQLGAATMWLKNRQRDKWRDKVDHEHTGADGGPIETITRIAITGVEPSGG